MSVKTAAAPLGADGTEQGASDDRHVCSVCLELLCRPAQPPCGHVFCQHCIRRAVLAQQRAGHAVTCPLCRATFAPAKIAPSADVDRQIKGTYAGRAARRLTATEDEARSVAAAWAEQHTRCAWRQVAVSGLLVASFIAAIDFTRPPPPTFAQSPEQLVADLDARQRKQMTSSRPTLNDAEARSSGCRLRVTDGGVWWTQPEDAPQHWATVGQLTVPTDSVWRLTVNLQGRRPLWLSDGTTIGTGCQKCAGPDEDWVERGVVFTSRASDDVRTYVHVLPSVRRVAADGITGHETLRLEVALNPSALNVYKLFGDEENPLVFEGQVFDWEPLPPASQGRHLLEESTKESQELLHSWDSFLTVGITGGVATGLGGSMGWVGPRSELESYGLDRCLGTPNPLKFSGDE